MNSEIHLYQIFDQLLLEMESANFNNAIISLAGVLDGAIAAGYDEAYLKTILFDHPIADFLREGGVSRAITIGSFDECVSSTAQKMHIAMAGLAHNRAKSERWKLCNSVIENAYKSGETICLLGDIVAPPNDIFIHQAALTPLYNVGELPTTIQDDGAIIHLPDRQSVADILSNIISAGHKFDRIIAPSIADHWDDDALDDFIIMVAQILAPKGRLNISTFLENHAGAGWNRVCEYHVIKCHSQSKLLESAVAAGLVLSQFQDASGSLNWGEFKQGVQYYQGGVIP